jgi:hypothetical protein
MRKIIASVFVTLDGYMVDARVLNIDIQLLQLRTAVDSVF